ncbi:hypothetical protein CZ787_15625 [Halomonas citrativorans]|uniref:Uncharacterized protein n=1 Tax=Halomonas citrativorans TaxID=2742612 RepID=A0A1R4I4K8_9GAMM|nr:hypothetical protein CZ787_15625 [Halomonas citrativorans]
MGNITRITKLVITLAIKAAVIINILPLKQATIIMRAMLKK